MDEILNQKRFIFTLKKKIKRLIIQKLSSLAKEGNIYRKYLNGNLSLKAAKIKQ